MIKCPTCKNTMLKRTGAFGEFYGCSKYPDCTTPVSLHDVDEKFNISLLHHDGDSYGACERCGEEDTLSDMGFCNYCQHMWDKD